MYCIVPIQYCNVMYCIPNCPDKVLFVHRSYDPRVCSYSVLVYNLQLFAKTIFCLFFSGYLLFYLCLTWLMTSSVMSMMMSSVISLMMLSFMTSSVMFPITQHQKQTFHIHIVIGLSKVLKYFNLIAHNIHFDLNSGLVTGADECACTVG